jgi:outer membrane protein assembly factor BamD
MAVPLLLTVAACSNRSNRIPEGLTDPDRYLYEQGSAALNDKKWITAREYFRQIVDGYPQSQYRAEAKLGLGDTFLNEGTTQAYIQAESEFREFLTFFPTHTRADYAQYRLALTHFNQMARPERDQTETRAALKEFDVFLERFPNSALRPEVEGKRREAQDRLSRSEYGVGLFYYRVRWYPGAIVRFRTLLESDPQYTARDAVYFHLAESLVLMQREAEALPYYERLLKEFEVSEYLEQAQRRVTELKAQQAARPPTLSGA